MSAAEQVTAARAHAAGAMNGNGAAPRGPDFAELELDRIDESPTNPRKAFGDLEELAASIREKGVLQPVLVRPSPTALGRFELVVGARRLRASKLAERPSIPAMIRYLDDLAVLECQVIENNQRSDVHPLEEADGYRLLRDVHSFSVEEIAAKIGRSRSYVDKRLRFCELTEAARTAFFAGKLTPAVALIVARIPDPTLQDKALEEIVAEEEGWDGPMNAVRAADLVRHEFMLRIVDASFDAGDAELLPKAGSCTACPKRTGAQAELFEDLGDKEDLCTDPPCFRAKQDAEWDRRKRVAKAAGEQVLSEGEAKKTFSYGKQLDYRAPYVDLDATCFDLPSNGRTPKTYRKVLGETLPPLVHARDKDGGLHVLVRKDDVATALKSILPPGKTAPRGAGDSGRIDSAMKREEKRRRLRKEATRKVIAELVVCFEASDKMDAGLWLALAHGAYECSWSDAHHAVADRRGLCTSADKAREKELKLERAMKTMGAKELRGLTFELLVQRNAEGGGASLKEACRVFKIDPEKVLAQVTKLDQEKEQAKREKKKAAEKKVSTKAKKAGK